MPANFGSLYFPMQAYIPLLYRGTGDASTSSGGGVESTTPSAPGGSSSGGSGAPTATPSNPGSGGGGSGGSGNIGTTDNGVSFPIAGEVPLFPFVGFNPIPSITTPFVDPIQATQEVGDFNTIQFNNALQAGIKNAKDLTQIDFDTLAQYYPQASNLQARGVKRENELNRAEIGPSNFFNLNEVQKANRANQEERLTQLEDALPGARKTILEEIRRSAREAGGSLISDIDNRAFDSAAANAAGEQNVIRGFGDDSVFGRRVSETLSAQQRLQLREAGTNNLNRFLSLGANLAFDQPIKYNPILDQPMTVRTSQDIRGTPSVSGAQLASSQQSALTALSTINPAQAIQFEIGQNQFQSSLDRQADMFNSTGEFEASKFNASGAFQSALEGFYADIFNAQQESNAINAGNAANDAKDAFGSSSTLGTVTSLVSAGTSLLSGINSLFGGRTGGTGTGTATGAGTGVVGAAAESALTSGAIAAVPETINGTQVVGSAVTDAGPGYLLSDGSTVAASSLPSSTVTYAAVPRAPQIVGATSSLAQSAGGVPAAPEIVGAEFTTPGSSTLGTLGNVASTAAAIYGAYTAYENLTDNKKDGMGGALSGAAIGMYFGGPVGAAVGAAIGYAAGSLIGGDKGKDQLERDAYREYGAEIGLFKKPTEEQQEQLGLNGDSYYAQLADGSFYNVGTDGRAKLPNYGTNVDGGTERKTFEIDWSDPRVAESVSMLNPLGLMLFGDEYVKMMGHMWNASASNTDSLSGMKLNMQKFASDAGLDYQAGVKLLNQYKQSGTPINGKPLSDEDYAIFMNSWNELMLQTGVPYDIKV